jgi:hypothetical protein
MHTENLLSGLLPTAPPAIMYEQQYAIDIVREIMWWWWLLT